LRLSMQGHGAILAICTDRDALVAVTETKDRASDTAEPTGDVDDDLTRLLHLPDVVTAAGLVRLARLDGATIVGPDGAVLAYGAIVRTTGSQGEGARTAAARTLSTAVDVAISISHDGPVTVYRNGRAHLDLL
jgi:DNA integrity scanning protein DisA with diadenylate cyclase activity